jgi:hypothetical protein
LYVKQARIGLREVNERYRLIGDVDRDRCPGGVGDELPQDGEMVVQAELPGFAYGERAAGLDFGDGRRGLAGL